MAPLLALLLPALLPVAADALKGIFGGVSRLITGDTGAKPQNMDEYVKMQAADIERMKALAALDQPASNISKWVADLRASFRYIGAGLIIVTGCALVAYDAVFPATVAPYAYDTMTQLMGSVFSFMFGDRVYLGLKQASK